MSVLVDAAGLVLDGGSSRRMGGRRKTLLPVDGEPIAHRLGALLARLFPEVLVAGPHAEPWTAFGARMVADPIAGAGPLAGIAAGLEAATRDFVFVVAADMPFVGEAAVRELVARARRRGTAIVPRRDGRPEPLHAVYPARLAGQLRRALASGLRRPADFLAIVPVTWVDASELVALPGCERTFLDVDAPEDLQALRAP